MNNIQKITVIGAGLAGCEAAWHLAENSIDVELYDMKPDKKSPAHELDTFAELVCSNSLRSDKLENAVGLLKAELRFLGSLILEAADKTKVPAGGALAVDRVLFSKYIHDKINTHPNIKVINQEITRIPDSGYIIIATGPLTSCSLSDDIMNKYCNRSMFFYDAIAPIIDVNSINMDIAFRGSRYNRGNDYINCPMNEAEYMSFWNALLNAETADIHGFEEKHVFEGCMPIESMAKRGRMTMAFGPLKPVGMVDPRTGRQPFAVVQLRQDDAQASMYNMVGFQTRLKVFEQKRVFSMIPGLEMLSILRYGVIHRNTYINSPDLLNENLEMKAQENLFIAGQLMGVEGYVESTASGLYAAMSVLKKLRGLNPLKADDTTVIGAIIKYCTNPGITTLKPMNANFGLVAPLEKRIRNKKERYLAYGKRAMTNIKLLKKE